VSFCHSRWTRKKAAKKLQTYLKTQTKRAKNQANLHKKAA